MEERIFVIKNSLGIHARPAAMFVELTSGFKSKIMIERDGMEVNGKSIMGILMLAAEQGAKLRVTANGSDASEALDAISQLINIRMFDEK